MQEQCDKNHKILLKEINKYIKITEIYMVFLSKY